MEQLEREKQVFSLYPLFFHYYIRGRSKNEFVPEILEGFSSLLYFNTILNVLGSLIKFLWPSKLVLNYVRISESLNSFCFKFGSFPSRIPKVGEEKHFDFPFL